ncbi:hypothetical protein ON010_g16495 [Phytophthora cinnamomi]|nr:hypothetical protein ON010_g16495 [Phytophthora cinnamomi]
MPTALHPETDGPTEPANRVVGGVLKSFATSFNALISSLPMVEFAINNAEHALTGLTPFYVNYGRHHRVPTLFGLDHSTDLGVGDAAGAASRNSTNLQDERDIPPAVDASL